MHPWHVDTDEGCRCAVLHRRAQLSSEGCAIDQQEESRQKHDAQQEHENIDVLDVEPTNLHCCIDIPGMQFDKVRGKEVPQCSLNDESDGVGHQDGQGNAVPLDPAYEGPFEQHTESKHEWHDDEQPYKEVKVQGSLQHEGEIRAQNDQNALCDVDDLKYSKNQGQSRCHQSVDTTRQDSQDDPLDD